MRNHKQTHDTMRRIHYILILLVLYLIQSGCFLKSVHPLVEQENAILYPGLEGIWETDDQRWTFINDISNFPNLEEYFLGADVEIDDEEEGLDIGNAYLILFEHLEDQKADTALFIGAVTELNEAYFLDLYVFAKSISYVNDTEPTFVDNHFFPVHTFSKIAIEDEELSIRMFKSSFIRDLISANRVRINHEKADDTILITASTEELRKFVEKYAHEEEAFEGATKFTFKGFSHDE
jgi:hypothetical protein